MSGQTAKTVTSFLMSEVVKMGYEVYSQESLYRLTEWTAERMMFGATDTKLIEELARVDVSELIFGSVSKTGNQFSISITLFDLQNSKIRKSISKTCDREDKLIELTKNIICELFLGYGCSEATKDEDIIGEWEGNGAWSVWAVRGDGCASLIIRKINVENKTVEGTYYLGCAAVKKYNRIYQIKADLISVDPVKFSFAFGKGTLIFEFKRDYLMGTYIGTYGQFFLGFKKVMREL